MQSKSNKNILSYETKSQNVLNSSYLWSTRKNLEQNNEINNIHYTYNQQYSSSKLANQMQLTVNNSNSSYENCLNHTVTYPNQHYPLSKIYHPHHQLQYDNINNNLFYDTETFTNDGNDFSNFKKELI